jgi:hypothetical protein
MKKQAPTEYEVKCVVTEDDQSGGVRITQLGGPGWQKKLSDVIFEIDLGSSRFFTLVYGVRAEVHKVMAEHDIPYVRTDKDNETTNNLLSLPACPKRLP